MTSLKSHAIREFHANTGSGDFHAEEIRTIGYTVLGSGLDEEQLQAIRDKIDAIYRRQVDEIGGEANLQRINDANMARCLLGYDDSFAALAAHPAMVEVLTRLLGDYYVLMSQNGVINNPADDHYQITWHRDLNYQHFVSSRPLAVSALYCIDEFSEETGATCVLPASHKNEAFPSDEYVLRHQTSMNAPAGSILMFDAMVFHRAGTNRSGRLRREHEVVQVARLVDVLRDVRRPAPRRQPHLHAASRPPADQPPENAGRQIQRRPVPAQVLRVRHRNGRERPAVARTEAGSRDRGCRRPQVTRAASGDEWIG